MQVSSWTVAELTAEELAAMLEKLDDVCRQAQELSSEIRKKMADTKRGDFQTADGGRNALNPRAQKKR